MSSSSRLMMNSMMCKYCSKADSLHPCIRHSICISRLQLYPSRCFNCQENYARAKAGDIAALRHWRYRLSALKGHRRHRLRLDEARARQIWGNEEERMRFGDIKDPMIEGEQDEGRYFGDFKPPMNEVKYDEMCFGDLEDPTRGLEQQYDNSASSQYNDPLSLSPNDFKPLQIESCMSLSEAPITTRVGEGSTLHQLQDPKIEIDTTQYPSLDDTPAPPPPSTAHSAIPPSGGGLGGTSELSGLCLVKRDVHCYSVLDQLMKDQTYTDVTITADGHTFYAHKIVLCVASSYFRRVLSDNSPGVRNVVVLRDISHTEMRNLLQFLYTGEATVEASDLPSFMRTAQMLEINSLSDGCLAPPSFPPTSSSAPTSVTAAAFGTTGQQSHMPPYVPAAAPPTAAALSVRSNLVNPQFSFSGQPATSATPALPFGLAANAMRLQHSNLVLEKPRQALHLQQQLQQQHHHHHQSAVLMPSLQEHSSSLIVPSRTEMLQIPKIDKIYSEKTRKPGRRRKQPTTESKVQMLLQSNNALKQQQSGLLCGTQQLQPKPGQQEHQTGSEKRLATHLLPPQVDHIVPEILSKALLRTPDPRSVKASLSSAEASGPHLAHDTTNGSSALELTSLDLSRPLSPPPPKSPKLCNGEQFKIKIRSVDSMTATDFDVSETVSSSGSSTIGLAVPESFIPTAEKNFQGDTQIGSIANVDCVPSVSQLENNLASPPRASVGNGPDILTDDAIACRFPCQDDNVISEDTNDSNCIASSEKSVTESQSHESFSHSEGLSALTQRYQEDDVPNKRRKIADENE